MVQLGPVGEPVPNTRWLRDVATPADLSADASERDLCFCTGDDTMYIFIEGTWRTISSAPASKIPKPIPPRPGLGERDLDI